MESCGRRRAAPQEENQGALGETVAVCRDFEGIVDVQVGVRVGWWVKHTGCLRRLDMSPHLWVQNLTFRLALDAQV